MKLLFFCALLGGIIYQTKAQVPIFEQHFSTGSLPSDYIDAGNPAATKFTDIEATTDKSGSTVVVVANGAVEFQRLNANLQGGFGKLSRSVDLNSVSNTWYVQFDVDIQPDNNRKWGAADGMARFIIGNGNTYDNAPLRNAETFGKLGFSVIDNNNNFFWTLQKTVGGTSANSPMTFQGPHKITWILNNTGYRVTYVKPAGAAAPVSTTIATGTWDAWVDGTPVFTAIPATNMTVDLRKFKFIFDGSFGYFRLDNIVFYDVSGVLPLSTTNFRASANGPTVNLNWQTENVADGSFLDVERSRDGREYMAIQRIICESSRTYYGHTDHAPLLGTSYYRLRQHNSDSTTSLSRPVAVNIVPNTPGLAILNNPTVGECITVMPEQLTGATYQLTTLSGQLLPCQTSETPDGQVMLLPQHPLPSGVYLLTATAETVRLTRRVLVR